VVGSLGREGAPPSSASVASAPSEPVFRVRSTQPLFEEPFQASAATGARASHGSARIDRIAMARASDFRENEFSRWGAR